MTHLTTRQMALRIIAIIASIELLIMLGFGNIQHGLNSFSVTILDVLLLVIFSFPIIFIWVIRPYILAREKTLDRIMHLAYIDPLTQVGNRRLLSTHLQRDLASDARHGFRGALLLLDLDGFKRINDLHGHSAGDAVLIKIAERLQSVVRSEDMVCRSGGDEFIILINYLQASEEIVRNAALRVADNLIEEVKKSIVWNGRTIQISASIGIRILGGEVVDKTTVTCDADNAMYSAKQSGGGCAVIFEK